MKRTHTLRTAGAALGLALLAAAGPAVAQGVAGGPAGAENGPAEILRRAQAALRGGQTARANDLLERAETRLLAGVEPGTPAQGDPAFHASEARRALMDRDRAAAMRHTNMAIATSRGGGGWTATGADAGPGARWGAAGGGPGVVDSGMGALPVGTRRAIIRDSGTGGTSVSRAEGVVLAQADTRGGTGAAGTGARGGSRTPTGLPPGDTIPGWSVSRGGTATGPGSSTQGQAPQQPLGSPPSLAPPTPLGSQGFPPAGPSSSSAIGGEPARVGGAPPADTSRAPGSSGIGGSGIGGPLR